jgi:chemotaxis protein MotA
MNSTFVGYVLFVIAAYVLTILGGNDVLVKELQEQYVPVAIEKYVHIPGLIFVLLGVFASTIISYNFKEVFRAHRSLFFVYFKNKLDFSHYIDKIVEIAQYTQSHDIESLEEYANNINYPFLREGLLLLVNGYKTQDVQEILEARMDNEGSREEIDDDVFRAASAYAPGYGMIGTTVGLIQMFSVKMSGVKDFGPILAGLAIAFTTTLYGLVLANFIFKPFSDKIERRNQEELLLKHMMMQGLLLISQKKHPVYIKDKLTSYIPQSRRLTVAKLASVEAARRA